MKYICDKEDELFNYLKINISNKSKNNIKSLLKNECILVNNNIVTKYNYIVKTGDIIEVNDKIGIVVSYQDFNKRIIALSNDLRVGNFHKQKVTFVKHYDTVKEAINSEEFNLNF